MRFIIALLSKICGVLIWGLELFMALFVLLSDPIVELEHWLEEKNADLKEVKR